jgi:putative oxidoreductase
MVSPQFKSSLGVLVARLGLAGILMSHGALKILTTGGAGWLDPHKLNPQLPEWAHQTVLAPWCQTGIAWMELIAGTLFLLGLLTRLAGVVLALEQLGAIIIVTGTKELIDTSTLAADTPRNAMNIQVGWEYNLALIALGLTLAILGGGMIAVDHLLFGRRQAAATPPRTLEPAPVPAPTAAS